MDDWLITLGITVAVAIVFALLSPLISPHVKRTWDRVRGKRKELSLERVEKACYEIYKDADREKFKPHYILGIDGGGCIVAAFLAQHYNVTMIEFAADRTNPEDPKFPKDNVLFGLLKGIIVGKKVLVVDDLSDRSFTLQKVKNLLKGVAGEVKIGVISKPSSRQAKNRTVDLTLYDYYPRVHPSEPEGIYDHDGKCTVHFPWDVWEHVKG